MDHTTARSMSAKPQTIPPHVNFALATAGACLATSIVHPLDVARVKSQVSGGGAGWLATIARLVRGGEIRALWAGLSAGLLRQVFYGTTRFGTFQSLQDYFKREQRRKGQAGDLPVWIKVSCALAAGGLAGFVGNPADVALTRMAGDARLPVEQRRNYRNGLDALVKIARDEGLPGLLRGAVPNVQRSLVVNGVMLATYSQTKDSLKPLLGITDDNSVVLQFIAGNFAGFLTAVFAVPADYIKTKIQYEQLVGGRTTTGVLQGGGRGIAGEGAWAVTRKLVRENGLRSLWTGFLPFFLKLSPHTTITFIVIEQGRRLLYPL